MREYCHPVVLTINGRADRVVLDASAYQKLVDQIDDLEALEGIKRGVADVQAGRVTPIKCMYVCMSNSVDRYQIGLDDLDDN